MRLPAGGRKERMNNGNTGKNRVCLRKTADTSTPVHGTIRTDYNKELGSMGLDRTEQTKRNRKAAVNIRCRKHGC